MKNLVVTVDRDNDLGRKTGITGPLLGPKKCTEAAIALAKADPLDTDANTIFEAVKVYEELKKSGKNVNVVALTGDERVGIKSDEEVAKQLKAVLAGVDGVIFVSDGADDEQLIPIIQSYTSIISMRRVVVKQAERLESVYYTILDFIKRVLKDRELSRLILGLPGIAAIFYALFGAEGWRMIVGVTGGYLLIKGLHLEEYLDRLFREVRLALKEGRPSFYIYLISILLVAVATAAGLNAITGGWGAFIKASDFIYLSAALAYFIAKALDSRKTSAMLDYVTSGALLTALIWTFDSVISTMLEGAGFGLTITPIFLGLVIIFAVLMSRKLIKRWKGY